MSWLFLGYFLAISWLFLGYFLAISWLFIDMRVFIDGRDQFPLPPNVASFAIDPSPS
jgi:hypothetical protein